MALWNSGVWDTNNWSTVEGTLALTLDDIIFSDGGAVTHNGTLALTLDDVVFAATGIVSHLGTLGLTLDDVLPAMSGNIGRVGTLTLTLDDILPAMSGNIGRVGTLALTLEDVAVVATGKDVHAGPLALTLEDIQFDSIGTAGPISPSLWGAKGGLSKKKQTKNFINEKLDIEKAVSKAINKSLGIIDPEDIVEVVKESKKKPEKVDHSAQIQEMMLKAKADALNMSIEQALIDAENDDEEAILMFL